MYRPWGKYDAIDNGGRYQVKRITVKPGAKLSVQMHHHRAEHWIVVSGTAKVTNGDKVILLTENESTYIPVGVVHALENPGKIPLELIEVQSGAYLGEDDIVRFEISLPLTSLDLLALEIVLYGLVSYFAEKQKQQENLHWPLPLPPICSGVTCLS